MAQHVITASSTDHLNNTHTSKVDCIKRKVVEYKTAGQSD
jgi:hypothetical protein